MEWFGIVALLIQNQGRVIISEKTEINYMQTKRIRLSSEEWHLPIEQIVHFNHLKGSGGRNAQFVSPCSQIFFVGDVPVDYKMEAVVLLIRFENMIKRFLNYVDGKKECCFRILNLNKIFMIIFCLVESVKQFVVIVNGAKFVT